MIKDFYKALLTAAVCIYATVFLLHEAVALIEPILPFIAAFAVISALLWLFLWRRR